MATPADPETLAALYGPSRAAGPSGPARSAVHGLLAATLPASDQNEIEPRLKNTFVLKKLRGRKKIGRPQPRARPAGSGLSARARRELGLFRLPRCGLRAADWLPMHRLWLGYMAELVDWSKYRPGHETYQIHLCRADYHGAWLRVVASAQPACVGLAGYVVMETKNTFQLLDAQDRLRIVPKAPSNFAFVFQGYLITLSGASLGLKPSERATKKWKMRSNFEL